MTGFGWLLLALGSAVQATEFQLNTDTPDSLCPELSMTRNAVRQRLGQLETEASGRWHGMYRSVHDPTGRRGDYVRLVISDAEGREQLTRELPMKGESCETLVQAIALVVDGFFRELAQSEAGDERDERVERVEVTENDAPKPQPAMEPTVVSPHLTLPELPAQRPIKQPRTAIALGAGYESVPSKSIVNAGLSFGISAHWNWQLQAGFPFSNHREEVPPGAATAYVIPTRLSLSYVLEPVRRLEWFIGPEGFLSLEHGATQKIPAGRNGWRVSPGIGAQTAVVGWVAQSIALYLSLAADVVLFDSRQFLVYEEPVFEFARTRLSATAGLRAVIWR
jgi:hypothetical protein